MRKNQQFIRSRSGRNGAREILSLDKTEQIFELRRAGLSFRQISAEMAQRGLPTVPAHCHRLYQAQIAHRRERLGQSVEDARELDLARIDAAINGIDARVTRGEPRAVGALVRLLDRRAKLLGLDAPTKSEVNLKSDRFSRMTEEELAAEIEQLQQACGMTTIDVTPSRQETASHLLQAGSEVENEISAKPVAKGGVE